ncbi:hypothetical protein SAMN05428995_10753 [Loktanella sp. DSM 29012]|uniref:hypothetical protein n=1 Tax=Loktanella sp. DSM 29012 TaxID=1881056 RepID=UPI0008B5A7EF|nr:hypothetical protein [Loktanella sp. DSM 29012]SEQ73717.1 hypothetical protein SAMN05428995_10753 [Loktanella sp. DSM 29012]
MLRGSILAVALAALAACALPGTVTGPDATTLRLTGGIVVAAPQGYCIDPQVTRPQRGFAFLAACAAINAASDRPLPDRMALITVQVGDANSALVAGSEPAFRAFLETQQGATLLGVSDIGGPVDVLSTGAATNAVTVYTRDTAPPDIVGSQPESWRLFTDLSGRVVTITVRGLTQAPLTQVQSREVLDQILQQLRAANSVQQSTT